MYWLRLRHRLDEAGDRETVVGPFIDLDQVEHYGPAPGWRVVETIYSETRP